MTIREELEIIRDSGNTSIGQETLELLVRLYDSNQRTIEIQDEQIRIMEKRVILLKEIANNL